MSVKDFRTRNEIIVNVGASQEENERESETVKRGASLPLSRKRNFLARRKKKGEGIRFFDLCVKNSGAEYYDHFAPLITFSSEDLTYEVGDFEPDGIIANLNEDIFSENVANWANTYRKVSKDTLIEKDIFISFEREGDTVSGDLSEIEDWTENGLVLSQAEIETLNIVGVFLFDINFNFADIDSELYKVTLVNDINAVAADFTPSPEMDIFLFPRINYIYGTVNYANGLHTFDDGGGGVSDLVIQADVLNFIYAVYPRTAYSQVRDLLDDFLSYQNNYAIWQVMKSLGGARLKRGVRDFIEIPPYEYFTNWQTLAPSNFPFPTIYTPSGINDATFVYNQNYTASVGAVVGLERLFCVIKKGNQFYYFWRLEA